MTPIYLAIYIGCSNDTNGNPRRGWYVSRMDGRFVVMDAPTGRGGESAPALTSWVEEGYNGDTALYRAIFRAEGDDLEKGDLWANRDRARAMVRETGRIEVTPGEYRRARKLPRFGGAS